MGKIIVPPSKVKGPTATSLLEATFDISNTATKKPVISVKYRNSFIWFIIAQKWIAGKEPGDKFYFAGSFILFNPFQLFYLMTPAFLSHHSGASQNPGVGRRLSHRKMKDTVVF
jgi:hypothetical protein